MLHSRLIAPLAALVFACAAFAQPFPVKPVRIIVAFPPGGSADSAARFLAEGLAEEWKQPVIVENRTGAGTTIAAAFVAAAPPDGYTLLHIAPGTHAVSSAIYRNLSYDPINSFAGVGQLNQSAFVVVVNSASKVTSLRELIDLARSKPGQVSYSSSGQGAGPHLVTEMIGLATGVRFLQVPFKGSAPATLALLSNQVDFSVAESSALPHIQSGKLRGLAISTASPSEMFRGIPTLAEAGVPGVEYVAVHGIAAPAGTPRDVVLHISNSIYRVVGTEDFKRRMQGLGLEAKQKNADEFHAFLADEVRKYSKLVADIGLKVD